MQEPTSGLDSAIAYSLMLTLNKYVSMSRKTVVTTIHQPSSQIFYMFHNVLLIADGEVMKPFIIYVPFLLSMMITLCLTMCILCFYYYYYYYYSSYSHYYSLRLLLLLSTRHNSRKLSTKFGTKQ